MNKQQIFDSIITLSKVNNFFSRLLDYLLSLSVEDRDNYLFELELKNFKDEIDIILYYE